MLQIGDLQSENTTLKDTVTSKDREIEEIYSSLASSEATVESKELNKRLAELANENMMLKDEINNYRDIVSEYVTLLSYDLCLQNSKHISW